MLYVENLFTEKKGSIINPLNYNENTCRTTYYIQTIGTQHDNKAGEIIGAYLLNMNLWDSVMLHWCD